MVGAFQWLPNAVGVGGRLLGGWAQQPWGLFSGKLRLELFHVVIIPLRRYLPRQIDFQDARPVRRHVVLVP